MRPSCPEFLPQQVGGTVGMGAPGHFPTGLDRISCLGPAREEAGMQGACGPAWEAGGGRDLTNKSTAFLLKGGGPGGQWQVPMCRHSTLLVQTSQSCPPGNTSPRRKPPDTGKAHKVKREGLCFPSQLPLTRSHITHLQTNYFEPDILKIPPYN